MTVLSRAFALNVDDPALKENFFVRVADTTSQYQLLAERVTATFPKTPAQARFGGGKNTYFPATCEQDGISIAFYETYDYKTTAWLSKWYNEIIDENGNYGYPTKYKKTIVVEAYLPGEDRITMKMTYFGCWPTDRNSFEYTYEDESGRQTVEVQFSVDRMKLERG